MLSRLFKLFRPLKGTPLHPQWLAHHFQQRSRRHLRAIRQAVVLDIGAGDSRHAELANVGNHVYRLDYPTTNQRYAQRPEVYADACRLPLADASADVVLLLEVLEHVACTDQALAEIRRVLKPDGQLYLSVPFTYPIHDAPYDFWRFTVHGLRALFQRHGFTVEVEIAHGNSLLTALQMLNLALLEMARDAGRKMLPLGVLLGLLAYPVCLLINLLAAPWLLLPWRGAACLGYFMVARRDWDALLTAQAT
jgi:SAM-dependent methyltransferase